MQCDQLCVHKKENLFASYGKERELLRLKILAEGTANVLSKNFFENYLNQDSLGEFYICCKL